MNNKIKKGLLDVTPDLEESKSRVKRAVLTPQIKSKKIQIFPQIILGCFILLSIILVSTGWQSDEYLQGFSEETLNMYDLLNDGDQKEEYYKDLIIAKYGELKGIKVRKQDVENLIASYKSKLPNSFNQVLKKNGITQTTYTKQYLTLKAQVQLIRESLLPNYEKLYPQFPQEVQAQLLLLDAIEEVDQGNLPLGSAVNIPAIVVYEGENARILALIGEKRFLEEQLIIMPKRDFLKLKVGEEVLLENSLITSVRTENNFKQFVVSQVIKVVTKNKTTTISAKQQKVDNFFGKITWQTLTQTKEPDMKLKTLSGLYSIWYSEDKIIIGSNDKSFVIRNEQLQKWANELMNN